MNRPRPLSKSHLAHHAPEAAERRWLWRALGALTGVAEGVPFSSDPHPIRRLRTFLTEGEAA